MHVSGMLGSASLSVMLILLLVIDPDPVYVYTTPPEVYVWPASMVNPLPFTVATMVAPLKSMTILLLAELELVMEIVRLLMISLPVTPQADDPLVLYVPINLVRIAVSQFVP